MDREVLKFFSKNCGTKNRVIRYAKIQYGYFCFSCIIWAILPTISFVYPEYSFIRFGVVFCITAINFVASGYVFNEKAKMVVNKLISDKVYKGLWNTWEVREKRIELDSRELRAFLNEKKLYLYKEEIKEKLMERRSLYKDKFPVLPAMIGAMFVSEYNNYSSWKYRGISEKSVALSTLIQHVIILVILWGMFYMVKDLVKEMVGFVYDRRVTNIEECISAFEYLEKENDRADKKIDVVI